MPHQTFKNLFAGLFLATLFFVGLISAGNTAYAVRNDYANLCDELESTSWDRAPHPLAILCPIVRLLNVFVLSAGAFFVLFVFISAIKYALSQGDPKALEASKQTLTMAVVGFLVIIGVYTILTILKNVLGLADNPITNPFGVLSENLAKLLEKFNISD